MMGIETSIRDWYTRQLTFLMGHTYFTQPARELREEGKQYNIRQLRDLLGV